MDPLYLLGPAALLMLLFGFCHQKLMARKIAKRISGKQSPIPKVVHVLVIATQLYELVLIIEHASLVTLVAALFLLAILVASKSGTEDYITDFHRNAKSR